MLKRVLFFVVPKNKWKQKTNHNNNKQIEKEEVYAKASNEKRIKK